MKRPILALAQGFADQGVRPRLAQVASSAEYRIVPLCPPRSTARNTTTIFHVWNLPKPPQGGGVRRAGCEIMREMTPNPMLPGLKPARGHTVSTEYLQPTSGLPMLEDERQSGVELGRTDWMALGVGLLALTLAIAPTCQAKSDGFVPWKGVGSPVQEPFVLDPSLISFWEPLDKRYFEVFRASLEMIHERQFGRLDEFFSPEWVRKQDPAKAVVDVSTFNEHGSLLFRLTGGASLDNSDEPGHPIQFPIDWKADPHKNKTWVFQFHSLLWLNPHLDAAEKGEDKRALTAFKIMNDWLLANANWPPENGNFVFDDHAMAERLKVLVRALRVLDKSGFQDPPFRKLLLSGILAHISLMATSERYSSWHNHAIIFDWILLEVLDNLPEFSRRQEILELAARRVIEQFRFAFAPDGVHKEHSPCYHAFAADMMVQTLRNIQKAQMTIPPGWQEVTRKAATFAAHVTKPDGTFPGIGDCTDGKVYEWSGHARRTLVARSPELQFATSRGTSGSPPESNVAVFPIGGWALFRNSWSLPTEKQIYAAVQSDFFSFGHYQEDDTSFVLTAGTQDLVIDPGLHSYNWTPEAIYMRKARAHNVLLIDDRDFEFDLKDVGLSGMTRYQIVEREDGANSAIVELTHGHYEEMGVTLYRQFAMIGEGVFLVRDLMESASKHEYAQLFHLAPSAQIVAMGQGLIRIRWPEHSWILWLKSEYDEESVVEGETDPLQGWMFPSFGKSLAQPVLRLTKHGDSIDFTTLIVTTQEPEEPSWKQWLTRSKELVSALESMPRMPRRRAPVPAAMRFER